MVQCCSFFFAHQRSIHHQFRAFYEVEDEAGEGLETDEEDTPKMAPTEAASRFYFQLTLQLAGDDLTKYELVNEENIYLCLSSAALFKDRAEKQQAEARKLQQKLKV
jgi:hypothetical protein